MIEPTWSHAETQDQLLAWLEAITADVKAPVFIGLDGRSGAGKSTLAAAVAEMLGDTVVIEGDQFYAGGSAATWDQRSIEDRADQVIDWRRQQDVLWQLRTNGSASWRSFDWSAQDWDSEIVPLVGQATHCVAAPLVILEGAYSCRPELHELLDGLVLLDPPADLRRTQLLEREGEAYRSDWERRWSEAEDFYFSRVMPPTRFDLVL